MIPLLATLLALAVLAAAVQTYRLHVAEDAVTQREHDAAYWQRKANNLKELIQNPASLTAALEDARDFVIRWQHNDVAEGEEVGPLLASLSEHIATLEPAEAESA